MRRKPHTLGIAAAAALLWLLPCGCTDEETDLGVNLADPATIYNGKADTLRADAAISFRDSMPTTGGYDYNIIGNYSDATFGSVSSEIYCQVALPSRTSTINFDSVTVDSVVLTLVKSALYPDSTGSYSFHFEVAQLAEAVSADDTAYHATSTLPVDEGRLFFSSAIAVGPRDTVLRLRLGGEIAEALNYTGDNEGFTAFVKGLRIRIDGERSDAGMMTVDFAAIKTCLTAYYRYAVDASTTDTSHYVFTLGHPFMHYSHNYATATVGADSIDGGSLLYLEPLGGYNVKVVFDSALAAFREAHPRAVVHHAELLMPVAGGDYGARPDRIVATVVSPATGKESYIADYLLSGADGYLNSATDTYRLRVTRHVQGLLRDGSDKGTILALNSRRNSAARVALNGIGADNPVRIALTYTE